MIFESFLKGEGRYGPGIASLDHKPNLEPLQFVKIRGQIVFAKGIPDEAIDFLGTPDEDRSRSKGQASLSEADDDIHRFICEELSSFFSDSLLDHVVSEIKFGVSGSEFGV